MSYVLNITKQADLLYIKATGTRTLESVLGIAKECVAACKQNERTRFLLDMQPLTGQLSGIDTYDFVTKSVPPFGRGLGLKAAILDLQSNRHRLEFLENLAFNTGINLRVFTNVSRAVEWLREGETSDSG
jgi:hypothetical protein